jgi:hypothetical protein
MPIAAGCIARSVTVPRPTDIMAEMVAIKGHFDGKVIIPDEPVDLPANQRLLIHVQPLVERPSDFRTWLGQGNAAPTNPAPRFQGDRDLWE